MLRRRRNTGCVRPPPISSVMADCHRASQDDRRGLIGLRVGDGTQRGLSSSLLSLLPRCAPSTLTHFTGRTPPTRPRCAAPSALPSRADGSGSPPRSPVGPSSRPAPVPAGRGAGAARGRPASPATDRRGLALFLDIGHPEWERPGRPGTRRGPACARGPSAGGPRPTPPGRGRPAAPPVSVDESRPLGRHGVHAPSGLPEARGPAEPSDRTGIGFHAGDRATPGSHLRPAGHAPLREPTSLRGRRAGRG